MMSSTHLVVGGLVAFFGTVALEPLLIGLLLHFRVIDQPSSRSSHEEPTPSGGGVAIALACVVGWIVAAPRGSGLALLVFTGACLVFLGFIDDVRRLPPLLRLGIQTVIAACGLLWLLPDAHGAIIGMVLLGLAYVGGSVSFVNAFNFMDGINGISVAQVLVAGLADAAIGWICDVDLLTILGIVLAAGALGFAPFNFPRARVFLGDGGSYFFGGSLAATAAIALDKGVPPEAALGPLVMYLVDTGWTIMLRVRRGERWMEPHRGHTYQRLVRGGWSHTRTTLLVGSLSAAASALGLVSLGDSVLYRAIADVTVACVCLLYLLMPRFVFSSEKPRIV